MEKAFTLNGHVDAVLVSNNTDSIISTPVEKIKLIKGYGIMGDNHAGPRLADSREKEIVSFGLPKGIEIANYREFSAISVEEFEETCNAMRLSKLIPYGLLGENLVISGIPKLTDLPPGTLLFFRKNESQIRTAVLAVWGENMPCLAPGKAIQEAFPDMPKLANMFPAAAIGKRGIVGSIYCSGTIHKGDEVIVKIKEQKIYT